MAIRILLVDDHKIMRDGLRAVLEKDPDFEIVAEASNGREAVEAAIKLKPDIIVMDVVMPELNGIDATKQIRAALPGARIIALTMHADKGYLTRMLRSGTAGYLLKDCAAEELIKALHEIAAGKRYISSEIATLLLDDYMADRNGPCGARRRSATQSAGSGTDPSVEQRPFRAGNCRSVASQREDHRAQPASTAGETQSFDRR